MINSDSSSTKKEGGGGWSVARLLPDQDQVEMIQAYSMLAYYPLEHTCESSGRLREGGREGREEER